MLSHTWDVSLVLTYLQKLYLAEELLLKEHSQKLVMLIALLSRQRTQTLMLINIENNHLTEFGCLVYIVSFKTHETGSASRAYQEVHVRE